ncbi:unnamed protein product [Echinostoma caproni]|uniref:HAUS augmin-like complex subunit 7 n=1 Tax=Echinostoma caproni TaxID=27848 RepID=A0A183A0G5_9TREM|nr:unnamed protein product [Echinostoma caproni]
MGYLKVLHNCTNSRINPCADVTLEDLLQYRSLLTAVASDVPSGHDGSQKRKKADQMDELKVLHSRVTKAQISIQKQLLECAPCSHSVLPSQRESALLEAISRCQKMNFGSLLQPAYQLIEDVNTPNSDPAFIKFTGGETSMVSCLRYFYMHLLLDPQAFNTWCWEKQPCILG